MNHNNQKILLQILNIFPISKKIMHLIFSYTQANEEDNDNTYNVNNNDKNDIKNKISYIDKLI